MPSPKRRRVTRRDGRSAVHPQREGFHEEEGKEEAEAQAAREDILDRAPANTEAHSTALSRADSGTRARAVQQLQTERGNAYVQRVVAQRAGQTPDGNGTGAAQVQRQKTPNVAPVQPPGNVPVAQPAPKKTWLQPMPTNVGPIHYSAPAFQKLKSTMSGHPYVGSLPTPTKEELALVQDANDYFSSSPLQPWETAKDAGGEYLQKRNKFTNMFEQKAYRLTLFLLEQSDEQAGREQFRYTQTAGVENPEIAQLKEAALHLGQLQRALLDMIVPPVPTDMERYIEPPTFTDLERRIDDPAVLDADFHHVDRETYNPHKAKFLRTAEQFKSMREIYGQRFPVLLGKSQPYTAMAFAPPTLLAQYVAGQASEVLGNIEKAREKLKPSKIWSLPPIIEQTKKLLGIEEGSGANDALVGKLQDIEWDSLMHKLGMAALQIGLAVAAGMISGGASLAVQGVRFQLAAASVGVGAKAAMEEYEQISSQKALSSRISLDSAQRLAAEGPGYGWLVFDIIGMVFDIVDAAVAFRNIFRVFKAADSIGDTTRAVRAIATVTDPGAASTAAKSFETLEEVEEVVRAQARVLKQEGKLAEGMTEDIFVERIMSSLRRQVATQGQLAVHQAGVLARALDKSHPHYQALVNGDRAALVQLLTEHGEWKSLVRGLERGGQEQIAKNLVAHRQAVVQEVAADLKGASRDKQAFEVTPMKGGTEDAISDIDLQIAGADAGEMLIRAEEVMAQRFGSNWSQMFRLNIYTEGARLTRYQEVLSVPGLLKPAEKVGMTRRITAQTEKYTFARMLQHAGDDPAALARVERMAQQMGVELDTLRPLLEMDDAAKLARRNELLREVDQLQEQYKAAKGAERAELAEKISAKQMEANFHTPEANIGPGSLARSGVAGLEKQEAYQAALTQLEMIEHILAQAGGDVARAAREYELFKYIGRFGDVAQKAGIDTPAMKYVRNHAKHVSESLREATEETAHLYQEPGKIARAGVKDVPQTAGKLPPVDDHFLYQQFEMFMKEVDEALPRLNTSAPRRPPPPTTRPGRTTAPMKAVKVAEEGISESGVPRIINRSNADRYYLVDAADTRLYVEAHLENGSELSLSFRTEIGGARSEVLRGKTEFKEALLYFEGKVQSIRGAWSYGTNLGKFNELTAAGKSLEEAALATWTGERAVEAGFKNVTVGRTIGQRGAYTKVEVLFRR